MAELRKPGGLAVPHAYLGLPPVLYGADLTVEKDLGVMGKGDSYYSRHIVVSNLLLTAWGIVNADLAATMEFTKTSWHAEKATSPFHTTKHCNQSKLMEIVAVPEGGASIEELAKSRYPAHWVPAMVESAKLGNDASIDWSNAIQTPALEPKSRAAAGGSAARLPRASGSNARGTQARPSLIAKAGAIRGDLIQKMPRGFFSHQAGSELYES